MPKKKMVRTTVKTDEENHKKLKAILALRGETIVSWFDKLVQQEIAKSRIM